MTSAIPTLGQLFDDRARQIHKDAAFAGKSIEEKIEAANHASDKLVSLNEEFGRALGDTHAPYLTTAQQDAIYEHVWCNDIGDGFADIEKAYSDLVNFLSTYPTD